MMYLVAFFVSPLYFLIRKKWGGFLINSFFYGIACLLAASFIGIMVAPFFWIIGVIHALWFVKKEMLHQAAEVLATKMAEKMSVTARPITK